MSKSYGAKIYQIWVLIRDHFSDHVFPSIPNQIDFGLKPIKHEPSENLILWDQALVAQEYQLWLNWVRVQLKMDDLERRISKVKMRDKFNLRVGHDETHELSVFLVVVASILIQTVGSEEFYHDRKELILSQILWGNKIKFFQEDSQNFSLKWDSKSQI